MERRKGSIKQVSVAVLLTFVLLVGVRQAAAASGAAVTYESGGMNLKADGQRIMRLEPDATSPNVIGGYSGNNATSGVIGAAIGGGGTSGAPQYRNRLLWHRERRNVESGRGQRQHDH